MTPVSVLGRADPRVHPSTRSTRLDDGLDDYRSRNDRVRPTPKGPDSVFPTSVTGPGPEDPT